MSDLTHSDDEAISSYLDGEATPDEIALIEADPELLAGVQEFESAAELLSTPVTPLPQSDVDRLINNALAQSSTSDRITDLTAVRAGRIFQPQRLAAVAATLLILAGAVGALIAFNSDNGEMAFGDTGDDSATAASDFADEYRQMPEADMGPSDDSGDDTADSSDDMADEASAADMDEMGDYAGDDMAEEEMAEEEMAEGDAASTEPSTPVATLPSDEQSDERETSESGQVPTISYRLLDLKIAESYETLDELIQQTSNRWQELVAAGASVVPQVADEQGIAEQALADALCGQTLRAYIDTLDHSAGSGGISVGETTIAGTPTTGTPLTIVAVELSVDTAILLSAGEPDCDVDQLASFGP